MSQSYIILVFFSFFHFLYWNKFFRIRTILVQLDLEPQLSLLSEICRKFMMQASVAKANGQQSQNVKNCQDYQNVNSHAPDFEINRDSEIDENSVSIRKHAVAQTSAVVSHIRELREIQRVQSKSHKIYLVQKQMSDLKIP